MTGVQTCALPICMQGRCQIDQVTIYCGRKNGLAFFARNQLGQRIGKAYAVREVFARSTGDGNSNISHSLQYKDGKKKG